MSSTAPLVIRQPYGRVHVTQGAASDRRVSFTGNTRKIEVRPTAHSVSVKPRTNRISVLNDLSGIAQSLNERIQQVIEDGGRQNQIAPITTGNGQDYILRSFGAPILTLFDGLGVWLTPNLSNDPAPVTLQVDATPAKPVLIANRYGIGPLPVDTLRQGTPAILFYSAIDDAWIAGTSMAELTQAQRDAIESTLAQSVDAKDLAQLAAQDAQNALDGVPQAVDLYLDEWTSDANSAFGQLQSNLSTLYYTSADTDAAIAGAVTSLETSLTDDLSTIQATLTQDYYTKTTTDSVIAAAIQEFDAGAANVTSVLSAVSDIQGYAEATAGFRVQADGSVSLLDLVAHNDGGESYSLAKLSADDIILDGSVTAPKLDVGELSAITSDIGTVTAGKVQSADGKFIIDLDNKKISITI